MMLSEFVLMKMIEKKRPKHINSSFKYKLLRGIQKCMLKNGIDLLEFFPLNYHCFIGCQFRTVKKLCGTRTFLKAATRLIKAFNSLELQPDICKL